MAFGIVYGHDDLLGIYVSGIYESIKGYARQFNVDHPAATRDQLNSHARNKSNIQKRPGASLMSSRRLRTNATLLSTTQTYIQQSSPPAIAENNDPTNNAAPRSSGHARVAGVDLVDEQRAILPELHMPALRFAPARHVTSRHVPSLMPSVSQTANASNRPIRTGDAHSETP